jgi:hypothetical protein
MIVGSLPGAQEVASVDFGPVLGSQDGTGDPGLRVSSSFSAPTSVTSVPVLHIHAETDVEAFIEGTSPTREAAKRAALVVRVDWEPVGASVDRVVETLRAHVLVGAG